MFENHPYLWQIYKLWPCSLWIRKTHREALHSSSKILGTPLECGAYFFITHCKKWRDLKFTLASRSVSCNLWTTVVLYGCKWSSFVAVRDVVYSVRLVIVVLDFSNLAPGLPSFHLHVFFTCSKAMCHYTGIIDGIFIYRKSVWQWSSTGLQLAGKIELKGKHIVANRKIKVPNIPHKQHASSALLIPAIAWGSKPVSFASCSYNLPPLEATSPTFGLSSGHGPRVISTKTLYASLTVLP